jgi:hypothetical protein
MDRYSIALGKTPPKQDLPLENLLKSRAGVDDVPSSVWKAFPIRYTSRCLFCESPASSWSGHVISDIGEMIIAGHCNDHRNVEGNNLYGRAGCYGQWLPEYGIRSLSL